MRVDDPGVEHLDEHSPGIDAGEDIRPIVASVGGRSSWAWADEEEVAAETPIGADVLGGLRWG